VRDADGECGQTGLIFAGLGERKALLIQFGRYSGETPWNAMGRREDLHRG